MGNYSRGPMGTTLPTVTTDLRDVYGVDDLAAVLTVNDGLYSIQPASDQYPGHLYKVTILSDTMWYNWTGKVGVATSTLPAHFQIYNNNTSNFDTITTDNVTAANTNFTFAGTQAVSVANGYKDGSNVVCCRVYQEFSSTAEFGYKPADPGSLTDGGFPNNSLMSTSDPTDFVPAQNGNVTKIRVWCKQSGDGASNLYAAVYTSTGSPAQPGTKVGDSGTNFGVIPVTADWVEVAISGACPVTASTRYWIVWYGSNGVHGVYSTSGAEYDFCADYPDAGTFPASFTKSDSFQQKYAAYAVYTPS